MTPCPRCHSIQRVPVPDSLALACEACCAITLGDQIVGTWGPRPDGPSLGSALPLEADRACARREHLVAWLGIEAAYLRLCERAGFDPELYDESAHPPQMWADIARFCQELGGVDTATQLVFGDENGEARTWFRILAGEAAA